MIKERQLEGIKEAKQRVSIMGDLRSIQRIIEVYSMPLSYSTTEQSIR